MKLKRSKDVQPDGTNDQICFVLTTLKYCRLFGDMIVACNILNGHLKVNEVDRIGSFVSFLCV